MKQVQVVFPHRPTAPFKEQDGVVVLRPNVAKHGLRDGVTYQCRSSLGAVSTQLPASGTVEVGDLDGSAATYNISVYPPPGHSILDGSVNEVFVIDVAFMSVTFRKSPGTKVWSAS